MNAWPCRVVVGLLLILSWQHLQAAPGIEIWITPNGVEGGSGTATDPYRTPTADALFNLVHGNPRGALPAVDIPANSTIHLMPGTFLAREGTTIAGNQATTSTGSPVGAGRQRYAFSPRNGWKIRGAGIDVTVIKLIDNHPDAALGGGKVSVFAGNSGIAGESWWDPIDGVEISDMTVDLNLQNQSVGHTPSAVALMGSNNRISRVRGINWGSTITPSECFVLFLSGHFDVRPQGYDNGVIEDCIVEQHAPGVTSVDGTTAIGVGNGGTPLAERTGGGWVIKGCIVRNVTASPNGGAGKPKYINAYGISGRGCEIHDNVALNIISDGAAAANAVYMDTWDNQDLIIRDNSFINVTYGVNYSFSIPGNQTNIAVINNLITVTNGGIGILFGGYHAASSWRKLRVDGNIIYPHVSGTTIFAALVATGDIEFSANNNVLESGGGTGYDFYTSDYSTLKVLSFRDNHNLRKKPLKIGPSPQIDLAFTGFHEDSLTFTPITAGWHKVGLNQQFGRISGRLEISSSTYGVSGMTDVGIAYNYDYGWPSIGELSMIYNSSTVNGSGNYNVSKVRLARYSNFDPSESAYGVWAQGAVEIEIDADQVGHPLTIRYSGMLRAPAYFANFTPYKAPAGATLASSKELVLGAGYRTTGPIYAGSSGQQVTDANGNVVSPVLSIVQPAQGGLGINAGAFPADTVPYTTSAGNFGGTALTAFGRDVIDSPDALAARTTLGAQTASADLTTLAGLSKTSGNIILANGSAWTVLPISPTAGKALVSSGTTAQWGDALFEAPEGSSSPAAATTHTAPGISTRLYEFVTLPTTEKFYVITGIEWKNGATIGGNTLCAAVLVNAAPPTQTYTATLAWGRVVPNAGASSVQRNSQIVSQPVRGGTTIGLYVQTDNASHQYGMVTVASANNRKSAGFPTGGALPLQENGAWVANTSKAYIKVYYRGYR